MKRTKKPKTTTGLRCERPGCGHAWAEHSHSSHPVPGKESEVCLANGCTCMGYIGFGPASLRRATRDQ